MDKGVQGSTSKAISFDDIETRDEKIEQLTAELAAALARIVEITGIADTQYEQRVLLVKTCDELDEQHSAAIARAESAEAERDAARAEVTRLMGLIKKIHTVLSLGERLDGDQSDAYASAHLLAEQAALAGGGAEKEMQNEK